VAGIAAPTLCLVGGESGPELREATERIVAALPDARTRILPGQGHGAMFTAPDLLAWEVERFLGRTSA
jgi:pimeloyl-ACP methyl ester carboxylesterase